MKNHKPTELREKTAEELSTLVLEERAALYKVRRDLVFRQVTDTASVSVRRHNIARMLTIIKEKEAKA
jgi:ribosomal protein L29